MAALFIWLWALGAMPAAVLGAVVQAEDRRIARAGRIAFAFLLGLDLLLAAAVFSATSDVAGVNMTRSLWWVAVVVCGIPLALVSGLAVRRGYAGHRVVLTVAVSLMAALYVLFPLAFVPATDPLTGLGRFAHDHHALSIAVLLIPTLILLANELRWKEQVAPGSETERSAPGSDPPLVSRRTLIGGAAVLLILIWISGTNNTGLLVGLAVVFGGSGLLLWRKHRSQVRSVERDLNPPQPPG
jgi:hypothetical protein